MSFLAVRGVEKSFGTVIVLRSVDLEVERGELLALLGPSGSGKSTLLRIIAGFESAERGSLTLEGVEFSQREPQRRGFGMVFQSYALFPHLNVFDNVAFGLTDLDRESRQQRVTEMLRLVQLDGLAERGIDQISGGQQQRVALARALAPRPKLLLLDEPLSNLDPSLRDQTRQQLRSIIRAVGITAILVTHEQEEAFELGDRVAVLDGGRIEQVASPLDLYRSPVTAFVAGFIGRSNTFAVSAETQAEDGLIDVEVEGWSGKLQLSSAGAIGSTDSESSQPVRLWARPEHLQLTLTSESPVPTSLPSCRGRVLESRLLGPYALVQVELDAPAAGTAEVAGKELLAPGTNVQLTITDADAVRLLR